MRETEIVRRTVRFLLVCLVIGSLLGGLVGVVMAGETIELGAAVTTAN
jgi:hypothetical protein